MYDAANLKKLAKFGELAPAAWEGFLAFDRAALTTEAQAALWKAGVALEGPNSDALKGEFRENGGKGVHFTGPGLREHAAKWVEKVGPWLERQAAGMDR